MKLLIDFLPIVIFFLVYKFAPETVELVTPFIGSENADILGSLDPIILATAVLIPATIMQIAYTVYKTGHVEKMQLVTLALVIVLGGLTVAFKNKEFIQWKPTIVNWLFAAAFLFSQLFTEKSILERMMGGNMSLPPELWVRLNYAWVLFFFFSGAANLYVAAHFSEDTWVNFKLFGLLGLTILFIVGQSLFLYRYINHEDE
ncbi:MULTISPECIES: septation protein A [Thalassolituus]|jgi:intracellular septation protein|uniref:Inner membrane-spanning protein YciB n=2 Tax=root TaxID=1 RepID=M5DS05_9GAMM|nr:septation protein A [Thalassolituus oleivorans]PHQ83521.1 MAG: septation protein A [Thalassobium sp.]AHK15481.1 septation protein A [Thalassolituus oleivorans R6-15]APR66660.1 septation protein A [Thalassolituus oleivorans]PHQ87289.1 MAG: septation protein A [Thalassobium sp.]CCU72706.1 Intracellular septation protein IspA [Thalassolituus oleivorans MIL-1]